VLLAEALDDGVHFINVNHQSLAGTTVKTHQSRVMKRYLSRAQLVENDVVVHKLEVLRNLQSAQDEDIINKDSAHNYEPWLPVRPAASTRCAAI
jgi:hypothetical protein